MLDRVVEIQNYWTSIIKNTGEFQQIAISQNPEFNKILDCIKKALQDNFIQEATEYGVGRWEKILKIIPEENATLDDRKIKILTQLSYSRPYSWRVLKKLLTSFVGENNYSLKLINDTSTIIIRVKAKSKVQFDEISVLISNIIPQNLIVDLDYME